jgi:hypothetical protein
MTRAAPRACLAVGLPLALACFASPALAAPCDGLAADGQSDAIPVLWIENGDTQEPLLKRIGKRLLQTAGAKVRIVYRNRPTCELADNFYGARTLAAVASRPARYIPQDPAWDPATTAAPTCDVPATPPAVDLAIGATFLSSCPTLPAKPTNVTVLNGPNQVYGFIVNKASSQVAITAEEGYLAFGFPGGTGEAAPWLDQNLRFIRGITASTTLTMSAAIGLTAGQMKATTPSQTSLLLLNSVASAPSTEAAIGILGTELYDQNRSLVKLLAFRTFKQIYAYYPDSSSTSFDKKNVRDGHYLPWSPTPYLFESGAGGVPSKQAVGRLFDLLSGKVVESDIDGLESVVASGLVPQCAMKVTRAFDGGDLSLFDPPSPCGCFFDKNVPGGATTCATCSSDTTCGVGKCRHGFCEVR